MSNEHSNNVIAEERKILVEEKKKRSAVRFDPKLVAVLALVVVSASVAAIMTLRSSSRRLDSDKAQVAAATIDLAAQTPGVLEELYVHPGDTVVANQQVARIGNELVKAKIAGEVISVQDNVGKLFNRGEAVVTMIDPTDLRVVVRIEEDKGLKDVGVGQLATFTVDAFGSKRYVGTVDEISPTSRSSAVAFTISDKREVKEFNVKIRFDGAAYPELKNGMSAKVSIFKE
jgi:membrane fusion protein (multidrug efflux system)